MSLVETNAAPPHFSEWLKQGTSSTHESLDRRIMSLEPFSDRERYALFLRTQLRLHQAVSGWYQHTELQQRLPLLKDRDRLSAVQLDCADFGLSDEALEQDQMAVLTVIPTDPDQAIGWLYTVEGSNLGAAFLLKYAKTHLQLSEAFGARHLAAHKDGRGLHWRQFKAALDALALDEQQQQAALQGAQDAFAFARANVEELLVPGVA